MVTADAPAFTTPELDAIERTAAVFAANPCLFFSHALQVETLPVAASPLVREGLWDGERQLLNLLPRAVAERQPIYVASGHALGKDLISGGIPLWWQMTRYPAKTILTGPTARQVHEITWNEMTRHVARWRTDLPPLGGRLLQGKYEWNEEHFILAFTTSASQQLIGKAQGFHSPHICVIVTEAQAVPNSVKEQLDGLLTSGQALFIAIGNPLVTTGWFAAGLRDTTHHLVLNLDCEDSPNVREGRTVIPGLVEKAWVEEKRRTWFAESPQHPLWLSKVKGRLPLTSVDSVFDRDLIAKSHRYPLQDAGLRVSLGVDVAEFGDDESAFCCVSDGLVRGASTTAKHEPMDTAGRAAMYRAQQRASVIVVDRIGVGAGVASALRELQGEQRAWSVLAFAGSERPTQEDSPYLNQRAEAYFYARDQVQAGHVRAPQDERTIEELCETRYLLKSNGKIYLEPKADIKERLGRSPDRADAWVQAVWGLQFATTLSPDEDLDTATPDFGMPAEEVTSGSHGYGWR